MTLESIIKESKMKMEFVKLSGDEIAECVALRTYSHQHPFTEAQMKAFESGEATPLPGDTPIFSRLIAGHKVVFLVEIHEDAGKCIHLSISAQDLLFPRPDLVLVLMYAFGFSTVTMPQTEIEKRPTGNILHILSPI